MSKSTKNIAYWLYENIDCFDGLSWSNSKEYVLRITWEKKGVPGYEDMLRICLSYYQRVEKERQLPESALKNRFYDSLKKSPYVEVIEKCTYLQEGNYLLCKLKICPINDSCSMDMDMDVVRTNDLSLNNFPTYPREKIDNFKVALYIDGKLTAEGEFDLSAGRRFHFENHLEPPSNPECFAKPEIEPFFKYQPLTYLLRGSMDDRLRYLFSNAARGVALKSTGGCLEVVRLCRMKVYSNDLHTGRFTKMRRWIRHCLFSFANYEQQASTSNPYLNEEVILAFGGKAKPGIPSSILLKLKSSLITKDDSSSKSVSKEDSFDQNEQSFNEILEVFDC